MQFLNEKSFCSPSRVYFRAIALLFLCNLFVHLKDVDFAIYADDNTPFIGHGITDQVISRLGETAESQF